MRSWWKLGKEGASSIMMVFLISSIATALVFQVSNRLLQQAKINQRSTYSLSKDLALKSALAYTKYALKNRWCMTSVWIQDPLCANNFVYALKHSLGLERLLLTEEETSAIWLAMQHLPAGEPNPFSAVTALKLDSIEKTVTLANFNTIDFGDTANGGLGPHHPLYAIVKGLKKAAINSLTFKLTRVVNNKNPDPPNWIRVVVRVTSDSGAYVEETVLLSAVEVGSYALLMNGAMNLSGEAVTGSNFNIPTTVSKDGPGLHFLSPVFLNGNLVIPEPTVHDRFANVTFHDKVVMAPLPPLDTIDSAEREGLVMTRNGEGVLNPFQPQSFGAQGDALYKDLKNFGGLLQGVQLQSVSDWGAFYLFDDRSAGVDPAALRGNMDVCIRRNQILADLALTNKSVMIVKKIPQPEPSASPSPTPDASFSYNFALSNQSNFYAATRLFSGVWSPSDPNDYPLTHEINTSTANFNRLWASYSNDEEDNYRRPVLKVEVRVRGKDPSDLSNTITLSRTKAGLSRSSTLTIPLFAVDETSLAQLETDVWNADSNIDSKRDQLDDRFNSLRNAIGNYNSALSDYGLSPLVPLVPNNAPRSGGNVSVEQSEQKLEDVQSALDNWTPIITASPSPTPEPSASPSPEPSASPSPEPSASPSPEPSPTATAVPEVVRTRYDTLVARQTAALSALNAYVAALALKVSSQEALQKARDSNDSARRPKFKLQVRPNRLDVLDLSVSVVNSANLSSLIEEIQIEYTACEIGTDRYCTNLRTITTSPYSETGPNVDPSPRKMKFSVGGAAYARTFSENPPQPYSEENWTTLNGVTIPETEGVIHTPPPPLDPQVVDESCSGLSLSRFADRFTGEEVETTHLLESFPFAGFNYDFTAGAKVSWNFHPVAGSLNFINSMEGDFHIYGIVDTCKIKSSMRFFSGFLVCKNFVIEDRLNPLDIVGTVIAGNVTIHPNALKRGIRWSSIYHPEGVSRLRNKKILRSGIYDASNNEVPCDGLSKYIPGEESVNSTYPANPIWNPFPDLENYGATIRCSPLTLRTRSDPFTWNSLEPLCGIRKKPDDTYENRTTCKPRRPMVFKEVMLGRSERQ